MAELYKYCLRCGKRLKTAQNKLRGYGAVCWELKLREEQKQRLIVPKINLQKM